MTWRMRCAPFVLLKPDEKDSVILRRVVDEIWNAGNVDLADDLFSITYVNHGGLIPDLVEGPEGIKFSVALYRAAYPALHIRVDSLSSREGTVHMRWTAQSKVADHANDTPRASTVEHEFSGVTTSSVVAGQIVESWTSWDSQATLRRLEVGVSSNEETS